MLRNKGPVLRLFSVLFLVLIGPNNLASFVPPSHYNTCMPTHANIPTTGTSTQQFSETNISYFKSSFLVQVNTQCGRSRDHQQYTVYPNLLSAHIIKIFIFPSDPILHAMNFWFGWNAILVWSFKNLKILFYCGLPMPLTTSSTCSDLWHRLRNTWLQAWLISLVLPL